MVTGHHLGKTATFIVALATSLMLLTASCAPDNTPANRIGVVVTVLPQAEFVATIGGDKVEVTVMVPPGASPHTYEPTPSQITALSQAKVYFKVGSGVEFELAWLDKLVSTNREMLVVDCSAGIQLEEITPSSHDAGDSHDHTGLDPHIWMSPVKARTMVENICLGLIAVDPENQGHYEQNREAYLRELTRLDADIRDRLSGIDIHTFIVYHPALGYFAREYGLTMLTIQEEGKEPTATDLVRLIAQAKEYNIEIILASPQFNPESAEVVARAIGGRVVFIDPLAREYIATIRLLLEVLAPVGE